MCLALLAGLVLSTLGPAPFGRQPLGPLVEEQPLQSADLAIIHTNDTRGELESCG